jgi:serine/threonine protein kinase
MDTDRRKEVEKRQLQYEMGKASKKIAKRFDDKTKLSANPIHVIKNEHVTVHKLLGRGGFNDVHEVSVVGEGDDEETIMAVKNLKCSIMKTRNEFYSGAVDLVTEAKLLNALSHKNIIHMYGASCDNDSMENAYNNDGRFCLYLDCLHDTVDDKFDQWRRSYIPRHSQRKEHLRHRLETIALPIAEAMEYLHSKNIIFRDLKPLNMGFDEDGIVKLFDFGLAREIHPFSGRRLTGATGSRRYMAPEVAMSCPYGLSADVYSFGVFLYECSTLYKPYGDMSRAEHVEKAIYGRYRPLLDSRCESSSLRKLIQKCWAKSPRSRPDFSHVVEQLREELEGTEHSPKQKEQKHNRFFFRSPWSPSKSTPSIAAAVGA